MRKVKVISIYNSAMRKVKVMCIYKPVGHAISANNQGPKVQEGRFFFLQPPPSPSPPGDLADLEME